MSARGKCSCISWYRIQARSLRYYKRDKFLIPDPENALLDELYFMAKKLRNIQLKDLIFKTIDKKISSSYQRVIIYPTP
jgi:hypothetical protein